MVPSRVAYISLLLMVAACAGRSAGSGTRVDRALISEEELRAAGYHDAYSTVQLLRPQWLNRRGPSTITLRESVKVYLDGSLLGGPEYLQQITVSSISSMRYLDGIEATQRWGLDHGLGAILVISRRGEGRF